MNNILYITCGHRHILLLILAIMLCSDAYKNTDYALFSYLLCLTLCCAFTTDSPTLDHGGGLQRTLQVLLNTEGVRHFSLSSKETVFSIPVSDLDKDLDLIMRLELCGTTTLPLHLQLLNANYDIMEN